MLEGSKNNNNNVVGTLEAADVQIYKRKAAYSS